jgi:hypothetical protein
LTIFLTAFSTTLLTAFLTTLLTTLLTAFLTTLLTTLLTAFLTTLLTTFLTALLTAFLLPSIFTMDSPYQYEDGATSPMFYSLYSASSPTHSLVPNLNPPVHSNALHDLFQSQKYDGLELAFFLKDCSYYDHVPMPLLRIFFETCKAPI